jgi:hypothetical protein
MGCEASIDRITDERRQKVEKFKVFDGGDECYLNWLREHPDGYVLNRCRCKSEGYLVLHRSKCRKIQDYNNMARPGGFTGRSYIKICAKTIADLQEYARAKGGRPDGSFSGKCRTYNP